VKSTPSCAIGQVEVEKMPVVPFPPFLTRQYWSESRFLCVRERVDTGGASHKLRLFFLRQISSATRGAFAFSP